MDNYTDIKRKVKKKQLIKVQQDKQERLSIYDEQLFWVLNKITVAHSRW
jgi:hypothetical protein